MNFKLYSWKTTQTTMNPTGIDVGLGVRISGIQKILQKVI